MLQVGVGADSSSAMERGRTWGVLWECLEKNGRMVDVYTDRDSMSQCRRGALKAKTYSARRTG